VGEVDYNISHDAVSPGIPRLGGSPARRVWCERSRSFLSRMRRRGRSYARIAAMLGTSREDCLDEAERQGALRRLRAGAPASATSRQAEPPPLGAFGAIGGALECRWVHGHTDRETWRMCAHRVRPGSVWCPHHYRRAMRRTGGRP